MGGKMAIATVYNIESVAFHSKMDIAHMQLNGNRTAGEQKMKRGDGDGVGVGDDFDYI